MGRIERALISVSDKKGIVEFSRALAQSNIELVSTGGTAATVRLAESVFLAQQQPISTAPSP